MGGRGLSAEEKRVKLLEIFHETKDFYQLKELEKLGPKLKGIVSQSVKDVLQTLLDDGLVQMDKIGASNFYWSFPSRHGALLATKVARAGEAREALKQQLIDVRNNIDKENALRVETETREQELKSLDLNREICKSLEAELRQYGACDPTQVEEKRRAIILAREAAFRWTDNYSITVSYFCKQYSVDSDDIRKHFNLDESFEDIC